ncbi:MAG: sugar transferase [Lachnospiraceae bacterium]|nr:sugar transferase [Lachnospiraceae bacterium]MEE0959842.1 sugar transferase [Lachnospiraceae bacterium]
MNKTNVNATTNTGHILLDILVGACAFLISLVLGGGIGDSVANLQSAIVYGVFILIYILSNKEERIYNITTFFYIDRMVKRTARSFAIAAVSTLALLNFVGGNAEKRTQCFIIFLVIGYIALLADTFIVRILGKFSKNQYIARTILAGNREDFDKFIYFVNKTNIKMNILGYITYDKDYDTARYLGNVDDLEQIIRKKSVDQVYFMRNTDDTLTLQPLLDICLEMGVTARVVMNFYKPRSANSYVSSIGTYPVVTYHTISFNNAEKVVKRALDIIGATFGILISSPIMLIAAIAIKIDSKGPIFFKQVRVGMNGRKFKIFKFRTMCVDAEAKKKDLMQKNEMGNGLMFKIENDPRVTKVGGFLRKTSIDELPQFFNVLKGDMSLVGTRPPTVDEVSAYERSHWRRISIKPGITGMWQVSGRSDIKDFEEVVRLDTQYIDDWSVWLDIKILIRTVLLVFSHKGAY